MWSILLVSLSIASVDVALIPGCPAEHDGSLSECQRRRISWAAYLYETNQVENFIVSGSAVHTPYVEAEALSLGLQAVGIPAEHIFLEPHALHSDENLAYALNIKKEHNFDTLGIATDVIQGTMFRRILKNWEEPAVVFRMNRKKFVSHPKLDEVRAPRVHDDSWRPFGERARELRSRTTPSWWRYFWRGATWRFVKYPRPTLTHK